MALSVLVCRGPAPGVRCPHDRQVSRGSQRAAIEDARAMGWRVRHRGRSSTCPACRVGRGDEPVGPWPGRADGVAPSLCLGDLGGACMLPLGHAGEHDHGQPDGGA